MKVDKLIVALSFSCLTCGFVNSAYATDTADLKVTGTLIMGSCTPSISNGGVVDYGDLTVAGMSDTNENDIGTKSTTLTLTCDSAMNVGFSIVDDRSDSEMAMSGITSTQAFGLGKVGNINIGSYSLAVKSVTSDGEGSTVLYSKDNGGTWAPINHVLASNTADVIYSSGLNSKPIALTTANFAIDVDAKVQNTKTLALKDDTPLDGQATFTIVYL